MRLYIDVTTTTGYDTKYAFAGEYLHTLGGSSVQAAPATSAYYSVNTFDGGYYKYRYSGSDWIWLADARDFGGNISSWTVEDNAGQVLAVHAVTENGATDKMPIQSVGMTSLNGYVGTHYGEGDLSVFIDGYSGPDTLRGSFGADSMHGGAGRDSILGGDGNDTLDGGAGGDKMVGGDGDDRYYVNSKKDKVVEAKGEGHDSVVSKIDYTLGKNVESVHASGSRDFTLTGNSAANDLEGSTGADTLKGLDGADTLVGGGGKDVLYGGKGKDSFVFVTNPQFDKPDTIKDFNHHDDTIKVSQTAFVDLFQTPISGANFALPPELFHASESGKAHDARDRILYDTDDGKLYFDPDGTGGQARVLFANLTDHPKLLADDIWVV